MQQMNEENNAAPMESGWRRIPGQFPANKITASATNPSVRQSERKRSRGIRLSFLMR